MPDANPCLNCGACCAYFRVSFYWGECASAGGLVPDELVTQVSPNHVAMLGTERRAPRCTALEGEVGQQVSCSIYHQRSSTCREFEASWVDSVHNEHCDKARAAFGLPPLEPEPAELLVPIAI
ncbi:YkgJ family cysteine cluster protein [Pseudomonas sp. MWU13-2105]|uniref:YkgJ family cysteine cluster protein n=1 Tax=Pseudomonas sp. MWU13-2105 TaxID=2935074 RepID=UPI00200CC553|nr:YkgJ family cysteine cluster protein [Pseudomonas sp. MWU13-2105]